MTIKIHSIKNNRYTFIRNGVVYAGYADKDGYATRITSNTGPGKFKNFDRDRCPHLFADFEAAI